MGLTNPTSYSQYASQRFTAPLAALIVTQEVDQIINPNMHHNLKENKQRQDQPAEVICAQLSPQLKCCVELASTRGSSS